MKGNLVCVKPEDWVNECVYVVRMLCCVSYRKQIKGGKKQQE